jgi:hypothetical protein
VTTAQTEPPEEAVEYEFTYSRSTGKMRFRHAGGEWLARRFVGQWDFLHTERNGTMHVRCLMQMVGDTSYCYLPDSDIEFKAPEGVISLTPAHDHSQCQVATDDSFPQGRDSHWRLCYARELATTSDTQAFWRLRDERSGQLWFVHDYGGRVNVNYLDEGSHIYVDGPVWVDGDGVAQFNEEPAKLWES